MEDRHDLTDEEWELLTPHLPGNPRHGNRWRDHRQVINGIMYRERAGCPWRDVPDRYGPWESLYKRKRRWAADGTWHRILDALRTESDISYYIDRKLHEGDNGNDSAARGGEKRPNWPVAIDSTVIRVHQHAAGAGYAPAKDLGAAQPG